MSCANFAAIGAVPFCVAYWLLTRATLPRALWSGLAAAGLFGLILGAIYQGATLAVRFNDQKAFVVRLKGALAELGYFVKSDSDSFLTFRMDWNAGLLAGRISVRLDRERAQVAGPKIYLRKLRSRLAE